MSSPLSTRCVSVRTLSALPTSLICGTVTTPRTLGVYCSDVIPADSSIIEVRLGKCGRLTRVSNDCDSHDMSSWLQESMRPARDHYEQNIEAIRDATNGDVVFRTTRPIQRGEELLVWFENSLSREYSIPILNPANIKGNDHYTCTRCDTIFQYPNPLKSHIKFHCPAVTPPTLSATLDSTRRQAPSIVSSSSPSSSSRTSPASGATWDYHHPTLHPFGIMSPMFRRSTASLPLSSAPWRASWSSFLHPSIGVATAAFTGYLSSLGFPYSPMPGCDSESLHHALYNTLTHQVDDFASEHRPSRSSDNRRSTFPVSSSVSLSSCLAAPPPNSQSVSDYFHRLLALQMSTVRAVGSRTPANNFDDPDPFRAVIGKPLDDDVIDDVATVENYDTEPSSSSSSTYHAPEDLSARSSTTSSVSGNYDSPITSVETFSSSYKRHRRAGNSTTISNHQYGYKSSSHRHKFSELALTASLSIQKNDKATLSSSSVINGDELPAEVYGDGIKSSMASPGGGYKCPYCGKLYSRKYGLKIHVRTHTGFKPLQCRVCRRPFGDPSNLNKHVRLHAVHLQQASITSASYTTSAAISVTSSARLSSCGGDRLDLMRAVTSSSPYACRHCGKVLVRRRDLERHIRSRHTEYQAADMLQSTNDMQPLAVTSSQCTSTDEMISG